MKMRKLGGLIALTSTLACLQACDKNENATRQFSKAGTWEIVQLTAGTTEVDKLPKWQISTCESAGDYCSGTWVHQNGSKAYFEWRFTNLGGDFEIVTDTASSDPTTMAYSQCLNFSGKYDVMDRKSGKFEFQSDEAHGYPGKLVVVRLEAE